MLKIIGIDPGLAGTGIGIVRGEGHRVDGYAFGSVSTPKEHPMPRRLGMIHEKLLGLLEKEKPHLVVVEDVFSLHKNPKSGITLGKVTGVILLAAYKASVPVTEVPVREVKQILTGNGNASKEQLERSVRHTLNHPEPIRPFHASDAAGLALIGLYRFPSLGKTCRS